jgi:hypothetical protein
LVKTQGGGDVDAYHIALYPNASGSVANNSVDGLFFFNQVTALTDLSILVARIRLASYGNSDLNITKAYALTWSINSNRTFYQAVLCMDERTNSSFMIVSYERLDKSLEDDCFCYDADLQENTFHASATDSNCNVPGQFIFQLNVNAPPNSICLYLKKKKFHENL